LRKWFGKKLATPIRDELMAIVDTRKILVTESPVTLASGATVFVEGVEQFDDVLLVVGWSTDTAVELSLQENSGRLCSDLRLVERNDVRERFGTGHGFILVAEGLSERDSHSIIARLVCGARDDLPVTSLALRNKPLTEEARHLAGPLLSAVLRRGGDADFARRNALRKALPVVEMSDGDDRGCIEAFLVSEALGSGVLIGWALQATTEPMWLEVDDRFVPISELFRLPRQDVRDAFASKNDVTGLPGFIARVDGVTRMSRVCLVSSNAHGKTIIHKATVTSVLPENPVEAVSALFSLETPAKLMSERLRRVDLPIIESLQKRWLAREPRGAEVWEKTYGAPLSAPEISIIVPVYGRYNFFQNQIVALCQDPEVQRRCEIIYVMDDPKLAEPFAEHAAFLARLWGGAFRLIGNGCNNGFSGANNLGVSAARGDVFLFLNSDVVPHDTDWLGPMVEVLQSSDEVGIVGAQLLHADGGVQHAGMAFSYDEIFAIWTNQHPGKGLLPDLLPESGPRQVDAVTGACLMIERSLLEKVGGWNTGYVIGDFEDSDLCLRVSELGLQCVYVPEARLTHLERQSFMLKERQSFNQRLTILNALLHEQRWGNRMPARGGIR